MVTNSHQKITTGSENGIFFSNKTALQLDTGTFAIAFKVSDFLTNVPFDDPSMVHWVAEIVESDGKDFWYKRRSVGTHKCTKEE